MPIATAPAIVFYVIPNLDSRSNPRHAPRHRASEAHFDFPLGSIYPSTCRAHFDVDLATSAKFFQAIYFASISLSLSLLLCEWLAVAAATPDPLTLSASMPTIAQLRRQEGEGRKEGRDRVLLPVWDLGMGRRQRSRPTRWPICHLGWRGNPAPSFT